MLHYNKMCFFIYYLFKSISNWVFICNSFWLRLALGKRGWERNGICSKLGRCESRLSGLFLAGFGMKSGFKMTVSSIQCSLIIGGYFEGAYLPWISRATYILTAIENMNQPYFFLTHNSEVPCNWGNWA